MAKKKLQNITLSADAEMIAEARRRATESDTTLNEEFRVWLEQFTRPIGSIDEYESLMSEMRGVLSGVHFTRDDANER